MPETPAVPGEMDGGRAAPDRATVEAALERVMARFPPDVQRRGLNRMHAELRLRLMELSPFLHQGTRLLDVGGGVSVPGLVLRELGCDVAVLDTWQEYDDAYDNQMGTGTAMLDRFRSAGVEAVVHDLRAPGLPFEDESFDIVTFYDVIEHLPTSPRPVLEEMWRVLRPGGRLVVTTPNLVHLLARLKLLVGRTIHFPIETWYDADPYFGHIREYTAQELVYMVGQAGFEDMKVRLTNGPQWNTRRRDGTWGRVPLPTSPFQVAKLLYFVVTGLVPSFRYGLHVLARKAS